MHQNEGDTVVLNYDNKITREFGKKANSKVIYFSSKEKIEDGVIFDNDVIKDSENGLRRHIISTKDIKLRGIHNYENICAAISATKQFVSIDAQVRAISNFIGVSHRLEFVKEIDGAKWYNDSIGSSPTRTISGLNSFTEPIILIAGGYDKHLDYKPLAKPIIDKVKTLILMGQTSEKIYQAVNEILPNYDKHLEIIKVQSLEEAVNSAKKAARKGDIVLFSPASASFDMFKNFEERGNKFKNLVNKM